MYASQAVTYSQIQTTALETSIFAHLRRLVNAALCIALITFASVFCHEWKRAIRREVSVSEQRLAGGPLALLARRLGDGSKRESHG
jgi:hypothetical protein